MNYRYIFSLIRLPATLFNRIKPQLPWWVKIDTAKPRCVYYFGPFENQQEAVESKSGYIEDLVTEQAKGIMIEIKQGSPKLLTVFKE